MKIRTDKGLTYFYQWDTEQKLELSKDMVTVRHCDFFHEGDKECYRVAVKDFKAPVPDEILQCTKPVKVWAYIDEERRTYMEATFTILERQKPPLYDFTPAEKVTFDDLMREVETAVANIVDVKSVEQTEESKDPGARNTWTMVLNNNGGTNPQTADFHVYNGTVGPKGEPGDITPELQALANDAKLDAGRAQQSAEKAKSEADRAKFYADTANSGIYTARDEDKLFIHGQGATQSKPVELKVGVEEGKNEASIGYIRTMGKNLLTFNSYYFEGNAEQKAQSARWNYICVEPKQTYTLHFNEPMAIIRVEGRHSDGTRYTIHESNFTDTLTFTDSTRKTVDIYIQSNTFFTPNAIEAQMEFGPRFTEYHAPRGQVYRLNEPDQIKVKKGDFLYKNADGFWYNGIAKLADVDQTTMESIEVPEGPFYLWCESHSHHYMQGLVTLEYNKDISEALDEKADKSDTYTKIEVDEALGDKADVITNDRQGAVPLVLADSDEEPILGMKIFGKTTQKTTEGNQLLNFADKQASLYGVDISVTGGIFSLAGKASTTFVVDNDFYSLLPIEKGTYIASGNIPNVNILTRVTKSDGSLLYYQPNKPFTLEGTENEVRTYLAINTNYNGIAYVYPMLNKGSSLLPYEPYTGGKPSPNPDYPQPIETAGGKGSIEVKAGGKNLLDPSTETFSGDFIFFGKEEGIHVQKDAQYVISTDRQAAGIAVYDKTGEQKVVSSVYDKASLAFVPPVDMDIYIRFYYKSASDRGTDFQLEVGSSATAYEPFKPIQSAVATTPNGLSKWDRIEKRDGVWGIDSCRGVVEKLGDAEIFRIQADRLIIALPDYEYVGNTEQDSFVTTFKASSKITANPHDGEFSDYSSGYMYMYNPVSPSIDKAKVVAWCEAHPTRVEYRKKTHTWAPLSKAEQDALNALHTYKPVTTITADEPVDVFVDYRAETKRIVKQMDEEVRRDCKEIVDSGDDYIKFKDGTAICWGDKLFSSTPTGTAKGNLYLASVDANIIFPIPFVRPPVVKAQNIQLTEYIVSQVFHNELGIIRFWLLWGTQLGAGVRISWTAIGKWK